MTGYTGAIGEILSNARDLNAQQRHDIYLEGWRDGYGKAQAEYEAIIAQFKKEGEGN